MPSRICLGVSGLIMPPGFFKRYAGFFLKSMFMFIMFSLCSRCFSLFFIDLSLF